jgi:hypothetical protein
MNAYAEAEPIVPYENQDDPDNEMPGWLWVISTILMPAATGIMTGMLENGWLPETFRIMLSNTQETEEAEGDNVEKSE